MNWSNTEIDHVKSIYLIDVSKDEKLKEAFSWKNTQPLLKQNHQQKGTKFIFLDYQLQFIKTYQFIKLNEKGRRHSSMKITVNLQQKIIQLTKKYKITLMKSGPLI